MAQQTAVWWLAEQLFKDTTPTLRQRSLIEEARAMEKEQIITAFDYGFENGEAESDNYGENYYNETYGKE
jgi:hypothetical protein